jgi:hypothetical protein
LLLSFGWRFGLGLRLATPGSPGQVQGWAIHSASPQSITLASESRLIAAYNVFLVGDGTLTWTTIVAYRRWPGRILWTAAAPVHHLSAPLLLTRISGPR